MRVWVVLVLLLSGCASHTPGPAGPDAANPLYSGPSPLSLYQFGPPTNGTPDAHIIVGRCAQSEQVMAYTINATRLGLSGSSLRMQAAQVPNATGFAIAAFVPSPDGLRAAAVWRGGEGDIDAWHEFYFDGLWLPEIPSGLSIPLADGVARVVVACRGQGAINYVLGSEGGLDKIRAPHYLEATVASGFDAFLAIGTEALTIPIPPSTAPLPGDTWSTAGNVVATFAQDLPNAVRSGRTAIEWRALGPGWAAIACSHQGWSDHGSWGYRGSTGGAPREAGSLLLDEIATLWLSQQLLFGYAQLVHEGAGNEAAHFEFWIDHVASSPIGWVTQCYGVQFGATLDALFGQPAAEVWDRPQGLVG